MRLTTLNSPRLSDDLAETVRRTHERAINELQALPAASAQIISDVTLPDATVVQVPHGLGRRPRIVLVSPPRNATSAGRIDEIRDGNADRSKFVVLKATGFTATITVDLEVK